MENCSVQTAGSLRVSEVRKHFKNFSHQFLKEP